ncbi:MAG: PIN domain-containing protein [Nitrososphaerales archaeon]
MTKVIFDSSFLMAVVEHPTTWFEDITEKIGRFEPVALECVLAELGRLASGDGRKGRAARVALELAEKFSRVSCGGARTDEEIVSAAITMDAMVATADRELARSLGARKVRVVGLRSGRVALL